MPFKICYDVRHPLETLYIRIGRLSSGALKRLGRKKERTYRFFGHMPVKAISPSYQKLTGPMTFAGSRWCPKPFAGAFGGPPGN